MLLTPSRLCLSSSKWIIRTNSGPSFWAASAFLSVSSPLASWWWKQLARRWSNSTSTKRSLANSRQLTQSSWARTSESHFQQLTAWLALCSASCFARKSVWFKKPTCNSKRLTTMWKTTRFPTLRPIQKTRWKICFKNLITRLPWAGNFKKALTRFLAVTKPTKSSSQEARQLSKHRLLRNRCPKLTWKRPTPMSHLSTSRQSKRFCSFGRWLYLFPLAQPTWSLSCYWVSDLIISTKYHN